MPSRSGADDDEVRIRDLWSLGWVVPLSIVAGCAIEADAEAPVVAGTAAASEPSAVTEPTDLDTGEELWTVVDVIDGDTIRVTAAGHEATVRLIGINAPESGECFYAEATDALQFAVGSSGVRLERDVSDVDRFGRWLRFVESSDGVDVGGELVAAGYARSQWYEPDTSRNELYDQSQAAAQESGVGLWAADAC
jgi:micrococcal nuclease